MSKDIFDTASSTDTGYEGTILRPEDKCPVGQYSGRPMGELPVSYLAWFITQDHLVERYPEIVEYYKLYSDTNFDRLTPESSCPVRGKYLGTQLKDVPEGWFEWIRQQEWFADRYPEVERYCSKYLDSGEISEEEAKAWQVAKASVNE